MGTFDSNGVFRIPGNNVEDETLDKVKKEDTEHGKKIEQEVSERLIENLILRNQVGMTVCIPNAA